MYKKYRQEWFSNISGDILAGCVIALTLIPSVVAFSKIAGVPPHVGLYTSLILMFVLSFIGARPGLITASAGAMALIVGDLVKTHGLEYLMITTLLTGILQVLMGIFRLDRLMCFISRSVIIGFTNALAILILLEQIYILYGEDWNFLVLVCITVFLIYMFPYVTKFVPSPLLSIGIIMMCVHWLDLEVSTVSDLGGFDIILPLFNFSLVEFSLETLKIIFPYALSLSVVGILEALVVTMLVDELTDMESEKDKECIGQGIGNMISGIFGGMAGCAIIGQTILNIKSGGKGRLSVFVACVVLFILTFQLNHYLDLIPLSALVGFMIVVSIGTFNWTSMRNFCKVPVQSNFVMLSTIGIALITCNLFFGVLSGVLMSALFFAKKISRILSVTSTYDTVKKERYYKVYGQVFFVSADNFLKFFNYEEVISRVHIDLSHSYFWDLTAVHVFDKVLLRFRREGIEVEISGLNRASQALLNKLSYQHVKDDFFI